jgi:hypothetical protein
MQGNRTQQKLHSIVLSRRCIVLSGALLAGFNISLGTGCGAPAAPLPPTLNLPQPVRDLTAKRVGNTVRLTFTVPRKTTDKLPVRGLMTAKLCRALESGPCESVSGIGIAAQQTAVSMDDTLPPDLTEGPARLLTYTVTVLNRADKAADPSAPAYAAAGAAPAPVTGFSVTPRRNGIVLAWQPVATAGSLRVDRTRTPGEPQQQKEKGSESFAGRKTPEEPVEQILQLAESASPAADHLSRAIDPTARTGNSYRYIVQRIVETTIDGHDLEIASLPTTPVYVDYRDVFPPPVPTGLVSVADTAAKSIDLEWTPDVDPGLAGYIVYRRMAGSPQPPERILPAGKPLTVSSFSDTTAQPGQRYAYSVSAIDNSGNESQRSAEVEDEWIAPNQSPKPQP